MTATAATPTTCPKCDSAFVLTLDTGMMFCPECRNEWDPKEPVAPVAVETEREPNVLEREAARIDAGIRAGRQAGEPLADEQDLIDRVDELGSYDTIVMVTHDDGGSGNVRTDRYTHHTTTPHALVEAADAARAHFEQDIGSTVTDIRIDIQASSSQPAADEVVDDDLLDEIEQTTAATDNDAVAYLESLIGHGITLEGGQRATILSFEDDDQVVVQLAGGDTAVVDFNDIVGADARPDDLEIVVDEIDDATAQAFGTGSLLFACMVIEAGVASIEGDGDEAHLVESPTGWFITDEDAVPLMEQASAAAVAMLIQTFALPRAALVEMVEQVRNDALAATATEDTGHDTNASDDE